MTFPTPWSVDWQARTLGPKNAHGNPVVSFADPVPIPVYGWSPPTPDDQPFEAGRTAVVRDLDVYAPSFPGKPKDHVTVAGVLYKQVGHPEDFNHGPFDFSPGVRVSLLRVEEAG